MMDGFRKRLGLAMAGKSPWGGGTGGDGPSDEGGEDSASGGDKKGPRNPWLPDFLHTPDHARCV